MVDTGEFVLDERECPSNMVCIGRLNTWLSYENTLARAIQPCSHTSAQCFISLSVEVMLFQYFNLLIFDQ